MLPLRTCAPLVLSLAICLLAPETAAAQESADLGFLAGCWERRSGATVTHEQWMSPLGGLMVGMSRTVRQGRAVEWEALRIASTPERTVYIAQPGGGAATSFPMAARDAESVTFENPTHDFPQRIVYQRVGADSLLASIAGSINGQERTMRFPMQRVACR
jgi:hypothetical protein